MTIGLLLHRLYNIRASCYIGWRAIFITFFIKPLLVRESSVIIAEVPFKGMPTLGTTRLGHIGNPNKNAKHEPQRSHEQGSQRGFGTARTVTTMIVFHYSPPPSSRAQKPLGFDFRNASSSPSVLPNSLSNWSI